MIIIVNNTINKDKYKQITKYMFVLLNFFRTLIMLKLSNQRITFFAAAQLMLSLSFLFGTWVIYIPQIIEKLNMSEGQLGITLFFASMGALGGTFVGKPLVSRFGEGKMSFYSIIGMAISMLFIFMAPSYFVLIVVFVVWGFGSGVYQIAVNSMVNAIERQQNVTIMSSCHAFFSMGALIAAGAGTGLLILLKNASLHIIISVSFVLLLQAVFYKHYYGIKSQVKTESSKSNIPFKRLPIIILLALISLTAMVSEGAIADWSGLFLQDVALMRSDLVGLGYAGFSLAMTMGRFVGDYFSKKYGALQIILVGFIVSVAGFVFVLTATPYLSLVGFFIVGTGFSIVVPEVYRLSANVNGVDSASGIAFVSGSGYVGFLAGPPLLGFIAEHFGLTISFISLLGLVAFGTGLVLTLKMSSYVQLVKTR